MPITTPSARNTFGSSNAPTLARFFVTPVDWADFYTVEFCAVASFDDPATLESYGPYVPPFSEPILEPVSWPLPPLWTLPEKTSEGILREIRHGGVCDIGMESGELLFTVPFLYDIAGSLGPLPAWQKWNLTRTVGHETTCTFYYRVVAQASGGEPVYSDVVSFLCEPAIMLGIALPYPFHGNEVQAIADRNALFAAIGPMAWVYDGRYFFTSDFTPDRLPFTHRYAFTYTREFGNNRNFTVEADENGNALLVGGDVTEIASLD